MGIGCLDGGLLLAARSKGTVGRWLLVERNVSKSQVKKKYIDVIDVSRFITILVLL